MIFFQIAVSFSMVLFLGVYWDFVLVVVGGGPGMERTRHDLKSLASTPKTEKLCTKSIHLYMIL
jgi:hypothetical protein